MMERMARLMCSVLTSLTIAVMAGCTPTPSAPADDEGPPRVNATRDHTAWGNTGRSVVYPLAPYRLSHDQAKTINRARGVLEQRCMKRFGFDIAMPEIGGLANKGVDDRYGLVDEEHARVHGYSSQAGPPGVQFSTVVPLEARPIYNGAAVTDSKLNPSGLPVPEGGCVGEARRQLDEGLPQGEPISAQAVEHGITKDAMADPRVRRLIDQWRSCLKKQGYDYPDPWQAVVRWNGEVDEDGNPTRDSITAALADVRCNKQVELARTWQDVDIELQRVFVEKQVEQLRFTLRYYEVRLKNAARILAGG